MCWVTLYNEMSRSRAHRLKSIILRPHKPCDLLRHAMQCVTTYLHPFEGAPSSWLWRVPQAVIRAPTVKTQEAAKELKDEERAKYAKQAAGQLNAMTHRQGFVPMSNGTDKSQDWRAKVYVNFTEEDLMAQITGPVGSRSEGMTVKFLLKAGHAIVATMVKLQGTDKMRFPRNFAAPKHRTTKGVVFVGLCDYEPDEVPLPVSEKKSTPVTRAATRAKTRCQKQYLSHLNSAYTQMADDAFADLKEMLAIHSDEEQDIWSLNPAKRRKVQVAFNMLSKCDDALYELAQNIADDVEDEEEAGEPVRAAPKPPPSQNRYEEQMRLSGKCVCGAKVVGARSAHDEMIDAKITVGAKKICVHDDWDKAGKMGGKCDKGKKVPLSMCM